MSALTGAVGGYGRGPNLGKGFREGLPEEILCKLKPEGYMNVTHV